MPEEKVESLLKLSGNHGIFLQRLAVDGVAPEIDWLAWGDDLSRDYLAQVFGEGQGKKAPTLHTGEGEELALKLWLKDSVPNPTKSNWPMGPTGQGKLPP